jgi:hypothetical protein
VERKVKCKQTECGKEPVLVLQSLFLNNHQELIMFIWCVAILLAIYTNAFLGCLTALKPTWYNQYIKQILSTFIPMLNYFDWRGIKYVKI